MLPPSEITFALLCIGRKALLRILALEAELLQFAFDGQGLGESNFGARLHGTFDAPDGLGGFVGWAERSGVVHDLFPVVLRLVDVVDEAEIERLFKAEQL